MYADDAPLVAPQQPMRPAWMGDFCENMRWSVVQGDALAYFIQFLCSCLSTGALAPDVTNYVFLFTVKASLDPLDPNTLAQVVWNEQHGTCGYTALIVLPNITAALPAGNYAFDLKYMTPSAYLTTTFARGELDVLPGTNTTLSAMVPLPPEYIPGTTVVRTARAQAQLAARQFAAARLIR
jgi:hypothetical protein